MSRELALISHPDCLLHEMVPFHPEQPARIQVIENAILNSPFKSRVKQYQASLATREDLIQVHNSDYVDKIFRMSPTEGLTVIDYDTAMNPHSLRAALRAAGSVIQAVDLVMNHNVIAFCNVRPPGHHAMHAKAMGFCLFNNVAVGVAHALNKYKLQRVLIFDFDVHHGNGTEDIFIHEDRVFIGSTFQYPFYPLTGAYTESTHIVNMPLPAGTSGRELLRAIEIHAVPAIKAFAPDLVFFSAGFDGHRQDHIAEIALVEKDFADITLIIKEATEASCKNRYISVLEGGYSLEFLGKSVVAHLSALF